MEKDSRKKYDNIVLETATNEYKNLLFRANCIFVLDKTIPIILIISEILLTSSHEALICIFLLLSYCIFTISDKKILFSQINKLDEYIIKISNASEDVENTFINWKYHRVDMTNKYLLIRRMEPIIWLLISVLVAVLKMNFSVLK